MYLLKQFSAFSSSSSPFSFTFHYVSIKTRASIEAMLINLYLHSTMYLLKRKGGVTDVRTDFDLHSTMYLLKPVSVKYPIKTFWIYIPLCIY